MHSKRSKHTEKGATLTEFAIAGTVFFLSMFAVFEFGRLLWTHNALADATRRGARYAVLNPKASETSVKNVVLCGNPAGCSSPIVKGLTAANVQVIYSFWFYSNFGEATVRINPAYQFKFIVPLVGTGIYMPNYSTTLHAESTGQEPAAIP
jgi:hypothetical protein